MESTKTKVQAVSPYGIIFLVVLIACYSLFMLDHETRSVGDLFTAGNTIALIFYLLPTYFLTVVLFEKIRKRKSTSSSLWISIVVGIPSGFAVVIVFMLWQMGRI